MSLTVEPFENIHQEAISHINVWQRAAAAAQSQQRRRGSARIPKASTPGYSNALQVLQRPRQHVGLELQALPTPNSGSCWFMRLQIDKHLDRSWHVHHCGLIDLAVAANSRALALQPFHEELPIWGLMHNSINLWMQLQR